MGVTRGGAKQPVLALGEAAVHLHPEDNVAVARRDLPSGMRLAQADREPHCVKLRRSIPAGHKLALTPIGAGGAVRRYGQVIGHARRGIEPGDHVHTHNLGAEAFERALWPFAQQAPVAALPPEQRRTFQGYRRPDGRIGTRNYVAVLSTVNCSAHAAREIARYFTPERLARYPHVDGVIALTHAGGCPVEQPLLQRTLSGMACHPNVGGALLVGLGCETNHAAAVLEPVSAGCRPVPVLVIQDQGGLRPTVLAGIAAVEGLLERANRTSRSTAPISEVVLALQCGGSDAWSGVTANPVVGRVADAWIREGGTAVLAETPEIVGAEQLLARRAVSRQVAEQLVGWVHWWEEHARRLGHDLDRNRSPGNEAGGLTTIYEKSLGAVIKAGSTPLVEVVDYAEPIRGRGLAFMNSPGYDPVSVTGQVASGCTLVLFTTGRGSVLGFKPAPSIKIASTTGLSRRMPGDIDLNAGRVLDGETLEAVAADLFELAIAVASGRPTLSEAQGVGEAEFCPWDREGVL